MKIYTFIGFGLIGGSIAKALKQYEPDCHILAYMRNKSKLEIAKADGIVDTILENINHQISKSNIIFLCTPVEYNEEYIRKILPYLSLHTLITDVGSTKSSIHQCVKELGLEKQFIGGHPMTGSEKTGYENSDSLLLENAYYILTTTKYSNPLHLEEMLRITKLFHSIPYVMDYHKHDNIVATISHLPHLIAVKLVNLVEDTDDNTQVMKQVSAGGFKDITRIASSSPIMWEQICMSNREAILTVLNQYIQSLSTLRTQLELSDSQAIYDIFAKSKSYRNSIKDEPFGLFHSHFALSVHVADRPGAISIISAILSAHSISIKNMGINHNRELGEGALHISFYDSGSCELAKKLLKDYGYRIQI